MNSLVTIANSLGLSREMILRANKIYEEVAGFLSIELAAYSPDIYPQGSFKLGTTIKPISDEDEYDVDFVCLLNDPKFSGNPTLLKKVVGDALAKRYESYLHEKDRCWKLEFEQFHVDVLPAIPDADAIRLYASMSDTKLIKDAIKIPQKGLKNYKSSNPKGYARWFFEMVSREEMMVKHRLIEAAEKLPDANSPKGTLQQVVMLLKRHRDIMFTDNNDDKPISIIISTLAAYAYSGQGDLLHALKEVASSMPDRVAADNIPNPVNPKENFADKWKHEPQKKAAFNKWLSQLSSSVQDLLEIYSSESVGFKEAYDSLSKNYGNEIVKQAYLTEERSINAKRKTAKLNVSGSGLVGTSIGQSVKANTFYGS